MKVRKHDKDGDMIFGRPMSKSYHIDSADGVAQCAETRLALWQGTWFLDKSAGTPWLQRILGKKLAVDAVVRARILGTPGLSEISEFESTQNPDSRKLTVTATINTIYGEAEMKGAVG